MTDKKRHKKAPRVIQIPGGFECMRAPKADELPKRLISDNLYTRMLAEGISAPMTIYDQWAIVRDAIELARCYFEGRATCEYVQRAGDDDRALLDALDVIARERMTVSYVSGRVAVASWLEGQGMAAGNGAFTEYQGK